MRKWLFWGTLFLVLAATNYLIVEKERVLASGKTVLLRLAPVDPRSLMQGDYMRLRYALADEVPEKDLETEGCLVLSLDENGVAGFQRLHQGEPLTSGEQLLFYRNRGMLRLGAESFFFEEGRAETYTQAVYGELKVDANGNSVLVQLRGEDLKPLNSTAWKE